MALEPKIEPEVKVEPEVVDPGVLDTPDPVEVLAQRLGWNPEFQGEGAVDAETFILRSRNISNDLSKQVRTLRKQLSAMSEGVEAIKLSAEQAQAQKINELKTQITELKAQRKQAIKDGDLDAVDVFDSRIEVLQDASKAPPKKAPPVAAPPPEYDEFVERNPWYLTDSEMHQYADTIVNLPENKGLSYTRLLQKVERLVKQEFPEKFAAAKPPPAQDPAVASPSVVPSSRHKVRPAKPKATAVDLSYHQRQIGQDFVARGVYKTLDDYAQSLQKLAEKEGR